MQCPRTPRHNLDFLAVSGKTGPEVIVKGPKGAQTEILHPRMSEGS